MSLSCYLKKSLLNGDRVSYFKHITIISAMMSMPSEYNDYNRIQIYIACANRFSLKANICLVTWFYLDGHVRLCS